MRFGASKPEPVPEHAAEGEIERVYHEIRQVLRVSGVNLNFRTWAGHGEFLPRMWDALRPNLETVAFEEAADAIRARAAHAAGLLGPVDALAAARPGESQRWQIGAALDLYHAVNPKLLALTAALHLCLEGEAVGGAAGDAEAPRVERGVPPGMAPMEMEDEEPDDPRLREIFAEIREFYSLPSINSDYRTLALWPDYLAAAWERLRPLADQEEYQHAVEVMRSTARAYARRLPYPVPLTRASLQDAGEDVEAIAAVTARFEQILPPLILNVALLLGDWKSPETLAASPFPARPRAAPETGSAPGAPGGGTE